MFSGTTAAANLLNASGAVSGGGVPTIAPEFVGRGVWYERGGFAQRQVDAASFPKVRRCGKETPLHVHDSNVLIGVCMRSTPCSRPGPCVLSLLAAVSVRVLAV